MVIGFSWHRFVAPIGLALLTLAIHGAYIAETRHDPAYRFPLVDAATVHSRAQALLRGQEGSGPYWQPPLYVWFLALIYGVVGISVTAARVANAFWAAAITAGTWAIARRLLGSRWAWVAGVTTALCGPLLFYTSQVMPTAMGAALAVAGAWMAIRAWEKPSAVRWAGSGFLWGASALAVPHLLAALPAVAGGAALRASGGESFWKAKAIRGLRAVAGVLGGVIVAIAPVTLRNWVVSGEWVLISTNSGINFYIGNNPHAEMTQALRPGVDWDRLVQTPYRQGARNAIEADRYFWGQALGFLRAHPMAFLAGLWRKTLLFLAAREIPRNLDPYALRRRSRILSVLVWRWGPVAFPFSLIGTFGLAGLVLLGTSDARARWTALMVALMAFGVILFFPTARYRAPLLPLMAVFAAGGLQWLSRHVLVPGWRWWQGVGVTACAALLVHAPIRAPTDGVPFEAELEYEIGAAFHARGGEGRRSAREHYRRALDLYPELADAHYSLGVWWMAEGDPVHAERAYRDALRIRPDHDRARINLAILLFRRGAREEAAEMLEIATMLSPGNARAWHNRGLVLQALGRRSEAAACFRRAAELERR